ncbi:MAG: FAD-binding oxidoreductase [Deltaproteobacteria bacterium]|nr:MAG: FAD-binding oxidoreductase [Deltaproteobacteria bacterium]
MKRVYDLVVIGGGVIGSNIAYNLVNDGFDGKILVIEKDPSYEFASTDCSGHGLRQSPAVGKCISELIQFRKYRTIDLSCFAFHRFETGKLVFEEEMV